MEELCKEAERFDPTYSYGTNFKKYWCHRLANKASSYCIRKTDVHTVAVDEIYLENIPSSYMSISDDVCNKLLLDQILSDPDLTDKRRNILKQYAEGKSILEISKSCKVSYLCVYEHIQISMKIIRLKYTATTWASIQKKYGINPEEVKKEKQRKKKRESDKHGNIGIKHSEETRKKQSEALKGRVVSEETKQKMRKPHLGWHKRTAEKEGILLTRPKEE